MPVVAALRCCLLLLGAACASESAAQPANPLAGATAREKASSVPIPETAPHATAVPDWRDLHRFMRASTASDGYLGAVTLIVRHGRIVDFRAYGHRDLARREPMRRDSIFRIYSMTKTIASAAVMLLVEQGRIDLDAPVARYLPELAQRQVLRDGGAMRPAASEIRIRELLTHTAGFAAGRKGDEAALARMRAHDPHAAADLRGFVERLSRAPLAADPGTRFGYDGAAIEVLARVVEVVARQPFDAFVRERIFVPLHMRDTGFEVPASQRGRVADITVMGDDGRLRIADGPSARTPGARLNAYPSGAGGLYSTACDYARFAQMLLDGGRIAASLGDPCDALFLGESRAPSDLRADATKSLGSRARGDDGHERDASTPSPPRLLRADTVAAMLRNQLGMLDPPVHQFNPGEGFGFGGSVVIDPVKRGQPGSIGRFGWPGAASTTYAIDPAQGLIAIALMQHLPREDGGQDLPRIARGFYQRVDAAIAPAPAPTPDPTR